MELVIKEVALDLLLGLKVEEASVRVTREVVSDKDGFESYRVDVTTTDAPLVIGRRGETLLSFQHVLRLIAEKRADQIHGRKITLVVDVDGYRKRQEEEALELASRRAEIVRSSGNSVKLPSMSPYLRRLVHVFFTTPEWEDIATESTGVGAFRAVVLKKRG